MPGAAAKLIKIYGVRAKVETTYGTSATPAAIDAIQVSELPQLAVGYANDGTRALPPGTMGTQNRVVPSGRTGKTNLKFEPVGYGSAYSASNLPRGHALFRACGLDAVVVTTGGSETVTYTPTPGPTGFSSVTADLFARGQQYTLLGAMGDFTLGATGPTIPIFDAAVEGLLTSAVTDAAVPSLTYTPWSALAAPKSVSIALSLNSVTTLVVKSWMLKMNRKTGPRLDQNSGGHAGWAAGGRGPTLELEIETPAIATLDLHALRLSATAMPVSLTIGSTQYNKYTIASTSQAQIVDVVEGAEDPTSTTKITLQLNPSVLGANDEFSILFN
jgi:hypothetical protein